jgi:hypothetical protein
MLEGTTMQSITSSYKALHVVHKQHMHRKVNKTHYSISIGKQDSL